MTRLEVLQTELSALELYLPYADGQNYYRDVARIRQLEAEIAKLKELNDAD